MTQTIAIVTGTSRGIGAALARHIDDDLAAHAKAQGVHLEQVPIDLADLPATAKVAQQICASLPRHAARYLLINNAGTVQPIAAASALVDPTAITAALNVNVAAVMILTAHFLAAVQTIAADRRILNISSGAGRHARAGWSVYCATKAALDMYTRVVKQEQTAKGVRIVALAPGIADTAMQAHIRSSDAASFPAVFAFRDRYIKGKLPAPAEVAARLIDYLNRADFGTTDLDDIRHYP